MNVRHTYFFSFVSILLILSFLGPLANEGYGHDHRGGEKAREEGP